MEGRRLRRVGIPFVSHEMARVRRAARRRKLTATEYIRQAAIALTDDDLGSRRHDIDPYGRRGVETHRLEVKGKTHG